MKNSFTYDRAWTIYKKYILPAYFIFLAVFLIIAAAKFNEADGGEQATLQNTACSGKRILFISSYTDDFPTVALQKKGISEVFDSVNESARYSRPKLLVALGILSFVSGRIFSVYEVTKSISSVLDFKESFESCSRG